MTAEEMLPRLRLWAEIHAGADAAFESFCRLTGCDDADSPLGRAIWRTFDRYTATLSELLGDNGEWLDWYCHDNDMGSRAMSAGYDSDTRPIATLEDLARLVALSAERGAA